MGRRTWTKEEETKLIDLYPNHSDKELCEMLGKNYSQLKGAKERLGLRAKWKGKADDLTGKEIGQFTVLGEAEKTAGSSNTRWLLKCNKCGRETAVTDYLLKHSSPESHCVCTRKRNIGQANQSFVHGGCGTRLYSIWCGMKNRTTNVNTWNYKYYGARGIKICDEWLDFANFQRWSLNNGYRDGFSIDRIDCDKNYSPDNCRWIPLNEQQANRRAFNPHKQSE